MWRLIPFGVLCASVPAFAGEFPSSALLAIGYREATVADFVAGPYSAARSLDPYGYLRVSADLTGDGIDEEARLLINDERGEASLVIARMTDRLDTYVLGTIPDQLLDRVGLRFIPAGTQTTICSGGVTEDGCDGQPVTLDRPMVSLFRFDGASELWWFDGEEFQSSVSFDPALSISSSE